MSRVGNSPISVPAGVTVDVNKANLVSVKGPKGEIRQHIDADLEVTLKNGSLTIKRPTDQQRHRAAHGLGRALIANMIEGVFNGYTKELELIGVGYRVKNTGNLLELSVGYSHPIMFYIPDEINLETKMEKGKRPKITLTGIDKQLIGQIAAKIRSFRKPEPYKGKGIRYIGEEVRRKAGKTAG